MKIDGILEVTSTINGAKVNNSNGTITFAGSNTDQWTSNLAISYSAGVFKIVAADGTDLSPTNPGYVTMPSVSNPGRLVSLKVTTSLQFEDDAGTSNLTNIGFGITEAQDWNQDLPFWIYVVNRADTNIDGINGNSTFAIARNPIRTQTPSSVNSIGSVSAAPSTDDENTIILLDGVTRSNYTSLKCRLIGVFRMRWSASSTDWTVQSLDASKDGIGAYFIDSAFENVWTMPSNQNGVNSGLYFFVSSGVAPTWATPANIVYTYKILKDGRITVIRFDTTNAGNCTNGSGTTLLELPLPVNISSIYTFQPVTLFFGGVIFAVTSPVSTGGFYLSSAQPNAVLQRLGRSSGGSGTYDLYNVSNNTFLSTTDDISLVDITYESVFSRI